MNLWQFLREKMLEHGDAIAFSNGNISYRKLVQQIEEVSCAGENKLEMAYGATKQEQAIRILQILASGDVAVPVTDSYGDALKSRIAEKVFEYREQRFGDLVFVMFTSGTTGVPKGVMLSHGNIIENIRGIAAYFSVQAGQKILICRPLSHIAVLTGELLFGLYKGLKIDFYEEEFQSKRLANYLDGENVEIVCCTPTLLYHLSKYLQGKTLKSVVLSGERLSEKLVDILKEKYAGIDFYNVYGLTENSPRVSALLPGEFFEHICSVGKPILHTEIRIENGELLVKSDSVMRGYLGEAAHTVQKLRNGYLHTGDMAEMDEDGYLYILGREDEMIIRSGLNIYPAEIENAVNGISGVEHCLVYGEDDVQYGQRICMKVVGKIEIKTLRQELLKTLPPHLVPSKIEIVESLPLTPSGKVKRK